MDFELGDAQLAVAEVARAFARERIAPVVTGLIFQYLFYFTAYFF